MNLKLLKKAVNQTAFLKAGIMGFAGSGKTYTASKISQGISNKLGNNKPVAFFDTETGSDYLIKDFESAGIELLVVKTRSFRDLIDFMKEAESACSVAIIDSITHVWQELMESYSRRLNRRNGLLFQDWGKLKTEWRQFTDLFLNSQMHVIMCGRAGFEYDFSEDESGKKELIKTGTKMKAETELGYEPSLLIEMMRLKKSEITGNIKEKGWINRAVVLKDRTNTINGEEFDYPKFSDFAPVINFLNIGGEHLGIDTSRNSEDLFENPDYSYLERKKQSEIALEELQQELVLMGLDGTSSKAKKDRTELLIEVFGSSSKTKIENFPLDKIKEGLEAIRLKREEVNSPELKAVNE